MQKSVEELKEIARTCRVDILKMLNAAGSGHPGGSLSCIDILTCLYFGGILNNDPANPKAKERDRFVLSKGHAAPALYAVLGEAGYFDKSEFSTLRKLHSILQGHPDSKKCPGVEVGTGSLGQGVSVACGIAKGLKLSGNDASVFTILGDGECQEGQVWESFMFASHYKLDNLVVIIDLNGLQIDGNVSDVMDLGDMEAKMKAFGFDVYSIDGHDYEKILCALGDFKERHEGKPKCILAKTTKGKGVSFMENQAGWHGKAPSDEELVSALKELGEE